MSAFIYGVLLHFKLNLRSKEILVHYYIVPLIFYVFIGGIFTSINPESYKNIIAVMTVFGVTMCGILGSPYPLVEFYGSENRKAYQVGHIPLWTMAAGNFISSLVHLFIMSMVIYLTAPFLFNAELPASLPAYFTALLMLIVASLSVGMVFGLFFRSASKMGMAGQLVFLPSIMLSGIMFPTSMLPNILEQAGKAFPATWAFTAMCEASLNAVYLIPLLAITIIALGVSICKLNKIHVE